MRTFSLTPPKSTDRAECSLWVSGPVSHQSKGSQKKLSDVLERRAQLGRDGGITGQLVWERVGRVTDMRKGSLGAGNAEQGGHRGKYSKPCLPVGPKSAGSTNCRWKIFQEKKYYWRYRLFLIPK